MARVYKVTIEREDSQPLRAEYREPPPRPPFIPGEDLRQPPRGIYGQPFGMWDVATIAFLIVLAALSAIPAIYFSCK